MLNQIVNAGQIKLMGLTNNPQKELMKSSINLNTSKYEGFSLTILEASECGIPTIAFDFGESAKEEILNDKTGYIAMNKEDYIEKLKYLMSDAEKLKSLSKESKHYSEAFQIENIIKNWIELFEKIKAENKKEV